MIARIGTPLVRHTVNAVLDLMDPKPGAMLPTETELATRLSISRSTVRAALAVLRRRGVIVDRQVRRAPRKEDRFSAEPVPRSKSEQFTDTFLAKLASGALRPGQRFSELELARESGISTVSVREALFSIGEVGLIDKASRRGWSVVRFTDAMVDELYEFRILLEVTVVKRVASCAADHPIRATLQGICREHRSMQRSRHDLSAFFDLDRRFHGALFAASGNRFVAKESTRVATLLHYQLQPGDSGQAGMEYGLVQHPPIITAILDSDGRAAERLMREHLGTSRDLMKQAVTALSE